MAHDALRNGSVPPASEPAPPRQLEILVVEEEGRVEQPDVAEVVRPHEDRRAAPGEHFSWLVVLPAIELQVAPIASEPTLVQDAADAVDHALRLFGHAKLDHARRAIDSSDGPVGGSSECDLRVTVRA